MATTSAMAENGSSTPATRALLAWNTSGSITGWRRFRPVNDANGSTIAFPLELVFARSASVIRADGTLAT
jgi:hypothetical protein